MPPTSSYDFFRVALQRLDAAEALLKINFTLDAHYIGGYAIECALKALILENTPSSAKTERLKQISSGAMMHRYEVLLGILRDQSVEFPEHLAAKLRRYPWSTDLRYETGRMNSGETWAFLKLAKTICDWAKEQMP